MKKVVPFLLNVVMSIIFIHVGQWIVDLAGIERHGLIFDLGYIFGALFVAAGILIDIFMKWRNDK